MSNERFELQQDIQREQYLVIDHKESEEKNAIVIYNDLGSIYFSSAPALCTLLNSLDDENNQLHKRNKRLNLQIQKLNKIIDALEAGTGRKIEELILEYCNAETIKELGL